MFVCFTVATIFVLSTATLAAEPVNRITILYDAFGKSSSLKKDWGFSAFVEYNGK
jgi:7,8-dihydropterin-6-yl-methyl-4-(beta-D-ribofuranosyl)aminobenzene 5'-phosphate synthase